jgi:hypothetical protein
MPVEVPEFTTKMRAGSPLSCPVNKKDGHVYRSGNLSILVVQFRETAPLLSGHVSPCCLTNYLAHICSNYLAHDKVVRRVKYIGFSTIVQSQDSRELSRQHPRTVPQDR